MRKKVFISLLVLPIMLHLFQLFFLHFQGKIEPKSFAHGFKGSYAQDVSGLDFSEIDGIFEQPFYPLGQGKQMLALVSQDGRFVLKLFNPMRPLKKSWTSHWKYWKRYSSLKWIKREWFGKKQRLKKLFKRHKIAFEQMKDDTGLIFVHLKSTKRVCHLVTVFDAKGKKHILELAKTPFVLQKKATLVPTYLEDLMRENRIDEAKLALNQMGQLLARRAALGITDRIQTMDNNYGFANGRPMQIEVGRIHFAEEDDRVSEKERILENFHNWTATHYAHLLH